jgi:alpha-galactosidase
MPTGHIGIRAERGDNRPSLLTHDEQYTLMSLWSIFRSPLMFGGDIPSSDSFTIDIFTNPEVLDVNQHSDNGRQSFREGDTVAWTADVPGSKSKYIAVFNIGDTAKDIDLSWKSVEVHASKASVRALWLHKNTRDVSAIQVSLRPHASILVKVTLQ